MSQFTNRDSTGFSTLGDQDVLFDDRDTGWVDDLLTVVPS